MTVYEFNTAANDYLWLRWIDESNYSRFLHMFNGISLSETWVPNEVEFIREMQRDATRPKGDTPTLDPALIVLSRRAFDTLSPLLAPHGEFLPLVCTEGDYVAFNTTRVIDALDISKSIVRRYPVPPFRLMQVMEYAFTADSIAGVDVFKLAGFETSRALLSQHVADAILDNALTGFDLKLVWSDEPGFLPKQEVPSETRPHVEVVAPSLQISDLDRRGSREIEKLRQLGLEALGLAREADPDVIQSAIQEVVSRATAGNLKRGKVEALIPLLGIVWGDTVCRLGRWQWIIVHEGGRQAYAIATKDQSHLILPLPYMQGLLSAPGREPTSLLLYNMLKAGQLPPSRPGGLMELG